MDKIFVKGIKCRAFVGAKAEERKKMQGIVVDFELMLSLKKAGNSGNINDTIDYSKAIGLVHSLVDGKKFCLIEEIAELVALNCLKKLRAKHVEVRVFKPKIAGMKKVEKIGVEIERKK